MPLTGTTNLPVADRATAWDAKAAKNRIFAACKGKPAFGACVSRAFLWRDDLVDPTAVEAWSLGYCDMIGGRLKIVPKAVAMLDGRRGVTASVFDPDGAAQARVAALYDVVRAAIPDWPVCKFAVRSAEFAGTIVAGASGEAWEGVIAIEGELTGDNRMMAKGALSWGEGPWPLIFLREALDHDGMCVGTMDEIWRDGDKVMGRGRLSESEDPITFAAVQRVRELLLEGAVGVSVSLDFQDTGDGVFDPLGEEGPQGPMVTKKGRIRHLAIVDVPAFADAKVALVAGVTPDWFVNPMFGGESAQLRENGSDDRLVWQEPERAEEEGQFGAPLTVTADGQIYGHAALWGRCHVGYAGTCVRPPREPGAYQGFLTGARLPGIPTGPLIIGTTHPADHLSAEMAAHHYAHSGFAVGDVTIGADIYGIWVAGAIRTGASKADVEALRGSALSGDWRPFGGKHRLIGLLAVNGPGFRVARTLAASGVLVTVGPGCSACSEDNGSIEDRVAALEAALVASLTPGQ